MTPAKRLWTRLRSLLRPAAVAHPEIRLVEGGFSILSDGAPVSTVLWEDVVRVSTYKVDLLTTDCVCVLFELKGAKSPVLISEEMLGFADLFAPLQAQFPSISADWYLEVMSPAFETNRRVLFESTPSAHATAV